MLIISFKKVSIRNNSELFSISYLHCYFNIRYRNVYLTALIFNLMPLSEIPYFKAIPVVSFILLYWYCIGTEFHIVCNIEFLNCLQQSDASNLKQIVCFRATVKEPSYHAPHKSHIFLYKLCLRLFIPLVSLLNQSDCVVHNSLPLPIIFFMRTIVPLPSSDSTCTSSIKASINEKPMPDRSNSGLVV